MKMILKPMLFIFIIMALFSSCNNEELFTEPTAEEIVDPSAPDDETPEDSEEEPGNASAPCNFNLNNLQSNQTVIINCIMDLDGATINVPSGVTLDYEGGEIINGTLNFSDNTTVSGNLLNNTLTLTGSNPIMKDPVFEFIPSKWGIVEGKVSDAVATKNRDILESIMLQVKDLGITTFKIDKMDAYFKVDRQTTSIYPAEASINIPSDFSLIMTGNTHLWTQPNSYNNAILFSVFEVNNIFIKGGVFHGDRDTHDYSDGDNHEWGHLLMIQGSKNVVIEGVTLMDAGGDGISIKALGHAYDAFYTTSDNVLITGNKIIRGRRLGLSITDGRNIIIENNEFIDSGIDTNLSKGTNPGWAIDIEPVWSNGTKYEIVEHVIIRNNTERGSKKGGFINARGYYITYENNTMQSTLAMGETIGSIVRNNVFENPTANSLTAIVAGNNESAYGNEKNKDNQVYGNTITGFDNGIFLQDPGIDLYGNTINACKRGIVINTSRDSKVRNNNIKSTVANSEGISNHVSSYINNVDIYDNVIDVNKSPFKFYNVNTGSGQTGFSFTIRDNEVVSSGSGNSTFQLTKGITFENNLCQNSGIRTTDVSNGNVIGNTFENGVIRISSGCVDINFIDNIITGGQCFYEDNTDAINIVKQNNTCN